MTGMAYLRPDDGLGDAAEMVEVKPHMFVRRDAAIAMGLLGSRARDRDARAEIRAEAAEPRRAHEVVGGFEGDCSAICHAEITLPGADRVNNPSMDAEQPGSPHPRRSAGQQTRLEQRDSLREAIPPEVASAPPAVFPKRRSRPVKIKRSLAEILADCGT